MNNAAGDAARAPRRRRWTPGIDGITLSAGLHLGSLALIDDHPRFRDVQSRHHRLVAARAAAVPAQERPPRSPARLHHRRRPARRRAPGLRPRLGELRPRAPSSREIVDYLRQEQLDIPLIPAGGIFTGTDAVQLLEIGAAAVQVATRFTVTQECGLPEKVQQEYFRPARSDVEVNMISPTGYPMRMLKSSPAIGAGIRPNCEAYGYLLDGSGNCAYIEAYNREVATASRTGRRSRSGTRPACARTCATSTAGPAGTTSIG